MGAPFFGTKGSGTVTSVLTKGHTTNSGMKGCGTCMCQLNKGHC